MYSEEIQMFAVIATGGKQYRVEEGQTFKFEMLEGAVGDTVTFDKVLMVSDGEKTTQMGAPYLAGSQVKAEIVTQGRHDKVRVIKFRRRKHYRRQMGHRQYFTAVKITSIKAH